MGKLPFWPKNRQNDHFDPFFGIFFLFPQTQEKKLLPEIVLECL